MFSLFRAFVINFSCLVPVYPGWVNINSMSNGISWDLMMVDSSISLRLLASLATASCLGVALYLYAKTEVPPYRTTTGPNSPFHNPLPSTLCAIPFALCSLIQHSAIHIPKSEIERFPLPHLPPYFLSQIAKIPHLYNPLYPVLGVVLCLNRC